jgi:HAD superfamily hydrolase (TIGR01484 family)
MPMNSTTTASAPLEALPPQVIRRLEGVLFDLDDTFTTRGKIPACALAALWDLKGAGLRLIPVTGRPAGWCDHIARMWPVDGVVGENGAFYFWFDGEEGRLRKQFLDPEEVRAGKRERLLKVRDAILRAVPGCAVASDQPYRESDLAIDYREDVAPLGAESVRRICELFVAHGATCKVSSIHVNGWFGDYDKLRMARRLVEDRFGIKLDTSKERFAYCGDSPNDEPMFRYFPVSVGVRNVVKFTAGMQFPPRYLTEHEGGEGFAEFAAHLLRHL